MAIPAGYTPLDYVGFTDRGAYANNVTYVINDIVDYRGEKWKCKITNTINVTPGENANWTIWIGAPANLVERIIAPLEENPATIAYGVGRQIIYDDYLFEVIKQINVGDTLVVYDPLNPSSSANIKLAPPVETQVLAIRAEADATDDMIAPTETNASASSQPYGVGEQLILNNVLYTVTSAIAQNDPLVISGAGQNLVVSDSITEQLADKADSDVMDGALALKANKTDIARIEGANMSKGYAVGEQFYHGGTLYTALKAIANEAAWSSLVEDTDYEEADVNYRIKNVTDALNSEITTRSSEIQALTNKDTEFTSQFESGVAPIQTNLTAKQDYYNGNQFYYNGNLCEASATIHTGDTIVIDANSGNAKYAECVTEQIQNLESSLVNNLLWTNPNPNNAFAAQSVDVDVTGYKWLKIMYKVAPTSQTRMSSELLLDGSYNNPFSLVGSTSATSGEGLMDTRRARYANGKVSFEDAYTFNLNSNEYGQNNSRAIPIYIYGVK